MASMGQFGPFPQQMAVFEVLHQVLSVCFLPLGRQVRKTRRFLRVFRTHDLRSTSPLAVFCEFFEMADDRP